MRFRHCKFITPCNETAHLLVLVNDRPWQQVCFVMTTSLAWLTMPLNRLIYKV